MRTYQDAKLTIFGRIDTTHDPKYANIVLNKIEKKKKGSSH